MAWDHNSTRRAELPPNWSELRRIVCRRADGQCERVVDGLRCTARGTDCHHAGHRDDDRPEVLEWLCADHHDQETQRQAHEGQIRQLARGLHPRHRAAYIKSKLPPR